jgi:hypothetical protein
MRILSDFEKLILIFIISLCFMFFILIVFHFWRQMRKDKLISKNSYNFQQINTIQITSKKTQMQTIGLQTTWLNCLTFQINQNPS